MEYISAGESHGKKLTTVVTGVPAGLVVSEDLINYDLSRRQSGYGRGGRQKIEKDVASITSGIRFSRTLGSPISIDIENNDWQNWEEKMSSFGQCPEDYSREVTPRPGHADLIGLLKHNFDDCRDVLERASARETASRVCAGAIAREFLANFGVEVFSWVNSISTIKFDDSNIMDFVSGEMSKDLLAKIEFSQTRCPDDLVTQAMKEEIDKAASVGQTCGGTFRLVAIGVAPGLGSYVQAKDRLTSKISSALFSIPAIKGVSFGIGFEGVSSFGGDFHDEIILENGKYSRKTNNAGGLEGGMTTGLPLWVTCAMKPIPTCMKGLNTVNVDTLEPSISSKERSDVCAVPAAAVVGEAELAMVLANAYIEMFGNTCMVDIKENFRNYMSRIEMLSR